MANEYVEGVIESFTSFAFDTMKIFIFVVCMMGSAVSGAFFHEPIMKTIGVVVPAVHSMPVAATSMIDFGGPQHPSFSLAVYDSDESDHRSFPLIL